MDRTGSPGCSKSSSNFPRSCAATPNRPPSPNDSISPMSPTHAVCMRHRPGFGPRYSRSSRNWRATRRTGFVMPPLRCAVLAGCGKGKEQPPLDEPARSALRRQARRMARGRSGGMVEGPLPLGPPRSGRPSGKCSSPGRPMPSWPASVTPMRWPSCRRPSGPTGSTSGPRCTDSSVLAIRRSRRKVGRGRRVGGTCSHLGDSYCDRSPDGRPLESPVSDDPLEPGCRRRKRVCARSARGPRRPVRGLLVSALRFRPPPRARFAFGRGHRPGILYRAVGERRAHFRRPRQGAVSLIPGSGLLALPCQSARL